LQIEELKAAVKDEDDLNEESPSYQIADPNNHDVEISEVLIGGSGAITREYLLQSLPSKEFSDSTLWHWFNSSNPSGCEFPPGPFKFSRSLLTMSEARYTSLLSYASIIYL
jgi:hypothetical protein